MKKQILYPVLIAFLILNFSCQRGTTDSAGRTNTNAASTINFNEDAGGTPWVVNVEEATLSNDNYRVANWTGEYLQLVFMSLKPGEIIDLENHQNHDQFIRIEQGEARVLMGETEDNLNFDKTVSDDWAILIPAGYWHKIENTGSTDLNLYTLYGPSEHPKGTIKKTYKEATDSHDHAH
jgi:mannose-6-phosphate isomerase-like protein (cupin superfamily)